MLRHSRLAPLAPAGLVLIALAVALAGCSRLVGARDWTMTAELAGGGTYAVTAHDASGRIDDVEIDPAGLGYVAGVANPAGQPNVVIVPWTGGACDASTRIDIAASGTGLAVTIRTTTTGVTCDAIGVAHAVRLTASGPLPAASVTVSPAP